MAKKKPSEILKEAKDLLSKRYIRGRLVGIHPSGQTGYCALGSVLKVQGLENSNLAHSTGRAMEDPVNRMLNLASKQLFGRDVYQINDESGLEQTLRVFDRAIRDAEETEVMAARLEEAARPKPKEETICADTLSLLDQ